MTEQDFRGVFYAGRIVCPYCGSSRSSAYKSSNRLHCLDCFTSYSFTVGTIAHGTHLSLDKWIRAAKAIHAFPEISIRKLAMTIGVSNKTSHRIKKILSSEYLELRSQIMSLVEHERSDDV